MSTSDLVIFWHRRDLRCEDNIGLQAALSSGAKVLPIFIFDSNILDELEPDDARISFIYERLSAMNTFYSSQGAGLRVLQGNPEQVLLELSSELNPRAIFTNKDYEPYARKRDDNIANLLKERGTGFKKYKDQVVFEQSEVMKSDGKPYTVFTPFKNKWLTLFEAQSGVEIEDMNFSNLLQEQWEFPSLEKLGFKLSEIKVREFTLEELSDYPKVRDLPADDSTSYLSPHLRFGTISVRQIISRLQSEDAVFLSELIWREFFMQILYHFPHVVQQNFRSKYDDIQWRNDEEDFERWCQGKTGYPMVDAGMRQLNQSGYMHNRVRMITAGFLCKHLLIDWRWGEAYFAKKLLDYDLSANNGNWQWSAGTGCDAAPYFRIFNPTSQREKFDPEEVYVKRWLEEYGSADYPTPMVEHKYARERALSTYKEGIRDA